MVKALLQSGIGYCKESMGKEMNGKKEVILNHLPLVFPVLSFLAKYAFLQLKTPDTKEDKDKCDPLLHFGTIPIGKSLQKNFDIFNPSPVRT